MLRRGRWIPLALAVALVACDDGVTPPPAAPTGVAATETDGVVTVTWAEVGGADSYTVQKKEVGGAFAALASGVTETSVEDDDVMPGATYSYRVLAVGTGGTSDPSDPPVDVTIGNPVATLSGTISGVRTLSADTVYTIAGIVSVDDGGELRIPAGTLLLGSVLVEPSALMVRVGGKLFSEGTATDPVVFTSGAPAGSRERGDWGGVVLNGDSYCNFPTDDCVGEGASGPYGGTDVTDDSGVITYTRIEYAGYEVSFGNELNALTLNGVGSGTEIHHVQTHYGSDDGVELFGGTVDLKYMLSTGISDDSFDYSTGWQGRGQFWISQHDPNDADAGWEVDGNEEDYDATPHTDPVIYNVTLVGKGAGGAGGTAGESTTGMLQRRGVAGKVYNAVIMGFGTAGFDIDNAETVGRFEMHNSYIFSNAVDVSADADGIDDPGIVAGWGDVTVGTDPMLTAPYNRTAPDFRPAAGSPLLAGFATPPDDGFFSAVDFIGGVDPDGTPWYEGWITVAQN